MLLFVLIIRTIRKLLLCIMFTYIVTIELTTLLAKIFFKTKTILYFVANFSLI